VTLSIASGKTQEAFIGHRISMNQLGQETILKKKS